MKSFHLFNYLFLFILFSASSYSQKLIDFELLQSNKEKESISLSQISSISEWKYNNYDKTNYRSRYTIYNETGEKQEETEYDLQGNLIINKRFIYDENGYLKITSISDNVGLIQNTLNTVEINTENGIIIKKEANNIDNSGYSKTFFFNKSGTIKRIENNILEKTGQIIIERRENTVFNNKGNKVADSIFLKNTKLSMIRNYEITNTGLTGKIIEKVIGNPNTKTISYKYNNSGLATERIENTKNGDFYWKWAYNYDKNGNLTEITEYDQQNNAQKSTKFIFEYKANTEADKYNQAGINEIRQGNIDKAIEYFQQCVQISASHFEAYVNLGTAYMMKKNYDMSINCFYESLKINPNYNSAQYSLACVYSLKNQLAESAKWLEKALQNGFNNCEHIKKDKDLDNLKQTSEFKQKIIHYCHDYYPSNYVGQTLKFEKVAIEVTYPQDWIIEKNQYSFVAKDPVTPGLLSEISLVQTTGQTFQDLIEYNRKSNRNASIKPLYEKEYKINDMNTYESLIKILKSGYEVQMIYLIMVVSPDISIEFSGGTLSKDFESNKEKMYNIIHSIKPTRL